MSSEGGVRVVREGRVREEWLTEVSNGDGKVRVL